LSDYNVPKATIYKAGNIMVHIEEKSNSQNKDLINNLVIKVKNHQLASGHCHWLLGAIRFIKIKNTSISHVDIPMGHGGDGFRREDIIQSAIGKAKTAYKVQDYQKYSLYR